MVMKLLFSTFLVIVLVSFWYMIVGNRLVISIVGKNDQCYQKSKLE